MPVKKHLLLVIIIMLSVLSNKAKAQYYDNTYREDSWHVTVGPDFMAVINPQQLVDHPQVKGGYVTYSRLGLGASVHAEYYPNPFVGLTLGTGVTSISAKTPATGLDGSSVSNYLLVPFKIGVKAFFSQTMFLGAETGLGYTTPDYKSSHMAKIISPQLGYSNNDTGWEVSLKYEVDHLRSTYISTLGLHIAYSFDLSN
jgi:hypothetical protein